MAAVAVLASQPGRLTTKDVGRHVQSRRRMRFN